MTYQLIFDILWIRTEKGKDESDKMEQMDNLFSKYLSCLYREERKYLNRMLREQRLGSAAVRFMMYIYHNQGSNQKTVCSAMGIDEGLGTRVMRKLEEEGMIVRTNSPEDARSHLLQVTEKGEIFVQQCKQLQREFWKEVGGWLTEDQKQKVMQVMEQLAENAQQFNQQLAQKKERGNKDGE